MKTWHLATIDCVYAPRRALPAKNLQNVMAITEFLAGSGKMRVAGIGDTTMKKIALIFALAFAITTGITVMTVIADMDLAMADSAGTVVTHPEQANVCDETAC
jgi:hypothetical protein